MTRDERLETGVGKEQDINVPRRCWSGKGG